MLKMCLARCSLRGVGRLLSPHLHISCPSLVYFRGAATLYPSVMVRLLLALVAAGLAAAEVQEFGIITVRQLQPSHE